MSPGVPVALVPMRTQQRVRHTDTERSPRRGWPSLGSEWPKVTPPKTPVNPSSLDFTRGAADTRGHRPTDRSLVDGRGPGAQRLGTPELGRCARAIAQEEDPLPSAPGSPLLPGGVRTPKRVLGVPLSPRGRASPGPQLQPALDLARPGVPRPPRVGEHPKGSRSGGPPGSASPKGGPSARQPGVPLPPEVGARSPGPS